MVALSTYVVVWLGQTVGVNVLGLVMSVVGLHEKLTGAVSRVIKHNGPSIKITRAKPKSGS